MPTDKRRATARRRAWGRGPVILRFEPLEDRNLMSASAAADLAGAALTIPQTLSLGDSFHATGVVVNQGTAAVTIPFHVNIYASPTAGLGPQSVLLGQATVPAGLQPGQQAPFDQQVTLPADGSSTTGTVYIGTFVDPEGNVPETNKLNNAGTGQGYDTAVVTIVPHLPASLTGASLGVYPDQAQWGQALQITSAVQNDGTGDSPPTRARVVLTPSGFTPGGTADVTVGNLIIPSVPASKAVTVTQNITLPQFPPAVLLGQTGFTLSVIQDADFVTSPMYPHAATRGPGFDQVPVAIALPANYARNSNVPRPDLTPTQVSSPTLPVAIGQPFQVTATVQNQGNLEAGSFKVRFLLVGTDGSIANSLYLGDAVVDTGLKAGASRDVVQTLTLPTTLPGGINLNTGAVARIAALVDPEHVLDDGNTSNNLAVSSVMTLKLQGTDAATTTVTPLANTTAVKPPVVKPAVPLTPAEKRAAAVAAYKQKLASRHTFTHNLKVFPKHVETYVKKLLKI